ncbi:MAG: hypothetical protein IK137_03980 [Bacilli bacterium]|nr:hypothetical protein [Bacilli bacterium]
MKKIDREMFDGFKELYEKIYSKYILLDYDYHMNVVHFTTDVDEKTMKIAYPVNMDGEIKEEYFSYIIAGMEFDYNDINIWDDNYDLHNNPFKYKDNDSYTRYENLVACKKDAIRRYLYYGRYASLYGKALCDYVEAVKLKESGSIVSDDIDSRIAKAIDEMKSILETVKKAEEKADENKLSTILNRYHNSGKESNKVFIKQ